MKIGSLFTGYGGLDMAVEHVLDAETVWHSDNDPGASRILAHHWPDVPNHGDITTIDWATVEPVEVLTGGFPCQPVSGAGRQKGVNDDRWLFDEIVKALGRLDPHPRLCVLENVPRLLTTGSGDAMAAVVHGLASVGYVGRYRLLRASDVGGPHRRERVFIIAHPGGSGPQGANAPHGTPSAAGQRAYPHRVGPESPRCGATAPDPSRWGVYAEGIHRWERITGRPAPEPLAQGRLSARFSEWLMGLPPGHVTDVPGLTRNEQLKALGNGVVPQQAEAALRHLLEAS